MFVFGIDNQTFVWYNELTKEQMFVKEVIIMTAATNIRYYRTNVYRSGRNGSAVAIAAKAIGAEDYTLFALMRRLAELKNTQRPTVVEINGIESDYSENKSKIDMIFKFLAFFSKQHRLVKFAVRVGNRRYVL